MRIDCPHCGERPVEEFTYLGDATPKRPPADESTTDDEWFDYVYLRDNPRGEMREYWHHSGGCRTWLVATRSTESHAFLGTVPAKELPTGKKP